MALEGQKVQEAQEQIQKQAKNGIDSESFKKARQAIEDKYKDTSFLEKGAYGIGNLASGALNSVKSVFEDDKVTQAEKTTKPKIENDFIKQDNADIKNEGVSDKISDLNSQMGDLMADMNNLKDQVDDTNSNDINEKYKQLKKDVANLYIHNDIKGIKQKLDQFTTLLNNQEPSLDLHLSSGRYGIIESSQITTKEETTENIPLDENLNYIIGQLKADLVDLKDQAQIFEKNQKLLYSPYNDMLKEIDQLYMGKYPNGNKIDEKNLPLEIEHYRKKVDDLKANLEYQSPESKQRKFEEDDDYARQMSLKK